MKKQSANNSLLKNGLFNALAKFSGLLFGVLSMLVLTRFLTEQELGVWAQFLLITTMSEIIRHSLVRNALLTYSQRKEKEGLGRLFAAAFLINVFFTLFSTLVLLLLAFGFSIEDALHAPGLGTMLLYFIPGNVLLTCTSFYEWRMQLLGRFDRILLLNIIRQLTNLVLLLAGVFFWQASSPLHLVMYFNVALLMAVLFVFYTGWNLFRFEAKWPAIEIRDIFSYGRFSLLTNTASSIYRTTDHFLVAALMSSSAVAPLSICIRLINIVDIPSQVMSEILFVKTAKGSSTGDTQVASKTFENSVGSALAIVLPAVVVLMLFPSFFLWVIGGAKYQSYGWLLQLTALNALAMPFMRQFGLVTDASGRPALNAKVMVLLMLVNGLCCYLFIRFLGLAGAPIGLFIAQAFVVIVILALLRKFYSIRVVGIWSSFIQTISTVWGILTGFFKRDSQIKKMTTR